MTQKIDRQEMIDKIYDHFIVKDRPFGYSFKTEKCEYISHDGNPCALGLFMEPEKAKKAIGPLSNIVAYAPHLLPWSYKELHARPDGDRTNYSFLCRIQEAHDHSVSSSSKIYFAAQIKAICKDFGLKFPGDAHEGSSSREDPEAS